MTGESMTYNNRFPYYFSRYSKAAIDDMMTAVNAAIDEDPLQQSVLQNINTQYLSSFQKYM